MREDRDLHLDELHDLRLDVQLLRLGVRELADVLLPMMTQTADEGHSHLVPDCRCGCESQYWS